MSVQLPQPSPGSIHIFHEASPHAEPPKTCTTTLEWQKIKPSQLKSTRGTPCCPFCKKTITHIQFQFDPTHSEEVDLTYSYNLFANKAYDVLSKTQREFALRTAAVQDPLIKYQKNPKMSELIRAVDEHDVVGLLNLACEYARNKLFKAIPDLFEIAKIRAKSQNRLIEAEILHFSTLPKESVRGVAIHKAAEMKDQTSLKALLLSGPIDTWFNLHSALGYPDEGCRNLIKEFGFYLYEGRRYKYSEFPEPPPPPRPK